MDMGSMLGGSLQMITIRNAAMEHGRGLTKMSGPLMGVAVWVVVSYHSRNHYKTHEQRKVWGDPKVVQKMSVELGYHMHLIYLIPISYSSLLASLLVPDPKLPQRLLDAAQ